MDAVVAQVAPDYGYLDKSEITAVVWPFMDMGGLEDVSQLDRLARATVDLSTSLNLNGPHIARMVAAMAWPGRKIARASRRGNRNFSKA